MSGQSHRVETKPEGRWEQFENMPDHGWISWSGGPPPLSTGDVDVRLRNGRLILFRGVEGIGGRKNPGGNWVHLGEPDDIIAWRLHPPTERTPEYDTQIPF